MVSILRAPEISEQKRKLISRRLLSKAVAPAVVATSPSIRHASPAQDMSQAVMEDEVKRLVERARLSMLDQFKAEAEAAREQARQQGLEEGRQAGAEEGRQSLAAELGRVRSIADQLSRTLESGVRGVEEIAVGIAFESVCKMLGNSIQTVDGMQALIRQAAAQTLNCERIVVRLHAGDLAMLREAQELDITLPAGSAVSWVADNTVTLGGCVVETDGGELDARLETQLDRLRLTLLAAR